VDAVLTVHAAPQVGIDWCDLPRAITAATTLDDDAPAQRERYDVLVSQSFFAAVGTAIYAAPIAGQAF